MSNTPYLITDTAITVFIDGKGLTVNKGDTRYDDVRTAIQGKDFDSIPALLDLKGKLISDSNGGLYLLNGMLRCDEYDVPPLLGSRIIKMFKEGWDITPLTLFLENINANPVPTAMPELYGFIEKCNLPITEDGHFLAYKMVSATYKDLWTGKMDNSVGAIVKMDRKDVNTNSEQTCSSGLHFCSEGYLSGYGSRSRGDKVVILKINPADVMSIPNEYKHEKGRACEYLIQDTIEWDELIEHDFTDKYEVEPEVEYDDTAEDNTPVETALRWEVRNSDTAELVVTFESRSEARVFRSDNPDTFIWDTLNDVVVAGRTNPEFDLGDLDGFSDASDEPEEDEDEDYRNTLNDRWEIRDSFTGRFKLSFNSRKYAREYRKADEFIWDSLNQVKVAGTVADDVDLNDLD